MPTRAPRICGCGRAIPDGSICKPCDAKRKARAEASRLGAHDRGYDHDWRKAAREFLNTHLYCAHCGEYADLVDHITPHKGNPRLFWDQSNWQALCRHCHNCAKQSRERRSKGHSAMMLRMGFW